MIKTAGLANKILKQVSSEKYTNLSVADSMSFARPVTAELNASEDI